MEQYHPTYIWYDIFYYHFFLSCQYLKFIIVNIGTSFCSNVMFRIKQSVCLKVYIKLLFCFIVLYARESTKLLKNYPKHRLQIVYNISLKLYCNNSVIHERIFVTTKGTLDTLHTYFSNTPRITLWNSFRTLYVSPYVHVANRVLTKTSFCSRTEGAVPELLKTKVSFWLGFRRRL